MAAPCASGVTCCGHTQATGEPQPKLCKTPGRCAVSQVRPNEAGDATGDATMESNEVNPSFFPPPPPRYKLFTTANIELARKINQINQTEEGGSNTTSITKPSDPQQQKQQILSIFKSESTAPTSGLSDRRDSSTHDESINHQFQDFLHGKIDARILVCPPNLDWVKENSGWSSFGDWQVWPDSSAQANLEGMPKMYDEKLERKAALQGLLNTLIYSYLELLEVLGTEGPTSLQSQHHMSQQQDQPKSSKTDQLVSHIELAAFNMHGLCNELRPRQARETLKLMMKEQARVKREKAKMVIRTCEELRNQLGQLKIKDDRTLTSV